MRTPMNLLSEAKKEEKVFVEYLIVSASSGQIRIAYALIFLLILTWPLYPGWDGAESYRYYGLGTSGNAEAMSWLIV